MADKGAIQSLVFAAFDDLNKTLPTDERLEKRADLLLFTKGGKLDSLGIVDLLMSVEQHLADKMGVTLSLFSDYSASDEANPFATVASLVDYVAMLIDRKTEE
jgi:acyl carrier protein